MMSALRGRGWVGQNMPIVLIKCVNGTVTRGGVGQKSEQFCGRNKWKPPNGKNSLIISFLRSAARAPH